VARAHEWYGGSLLRWGVPMAARGRVSGAEPAAALPGGVRRDRRTEPDRGVDAADAGSVAVTRELREEGDTGEIGDSVPLSPWSPPLRPLPSPLLLPLWLWLPLRLWLRSSTG
jgi:hypothetical protein